LITGNLDLIAERLPFADSLSFPNPFSEKEQAFLKESMEIFQRRQYRRNIIKK